VTRPEQVWVAEITSVRLHHEFLDLAVLMDVFPRGIRGWDPGRSPEGSPALVARKRALCRGGPAIHHCDPGVRDAAMASTAMPVGREVAIGLAAVGEPEEDGFAERLMRTIKGEGVDLSESEDLADARRPSGRFLDDVDTTKRIHSALGDLTPGEFEQQWVDMQRSESSVVT
jgi:putative transposase